jgi:hypothetical protein
MSIAQLPENSRFSVGNSFPKNDLGEAALSGQKLNASAASPPPKRLTFSFTIGLKQ